MWQEKLVCQIAEVSGWEIASWGKEAFLWRSDMWGMVSSICGSFLGERKLQSVSLSVLPPLSVRAAGCICRQFSWTWGSVVSQLCWWPFVRAMPVCSLVTYFIVVPASVCSAVGICAHALTVSLCSAYSRMVSIKHTFRMIGNGLHFWSSVYSGMYFILCKLLHRQHFSVSKCFPLIVSLVWNSIWAAVSTLAAVSDHSSLTSDRLFYLPPVLSWMSRLLPHPPSLIRLLVPLVPVGQSCWKHAAHRACTPLIPGSTSPSIRPVCQGYWP